MSTLVSAALTAATPASVVDRIVTSLSGHQWAVITLAALALVLLVTARLTSRRSEETLNQRSAREVEEARR